MNQTHRPMSRPCFRSTVLFCGAALLVASGFIASPVLACLTGNIDKRTIQWSTSIVQAKLVSLGTRYDIDASASPASSGKPMANGYRSVSFEVTATIDGSLQTGQTFKVLGLIGGRPGDGMCPALMPDSVGKKFILMLRPFESTRIDLPNGTPLNVSPNTMVIVSQLGEDDVNADTFSDLKKLVGQTHDAVAAVTSDTISSQVEAVAAAHDATEAEQAEKALEDIGPAALPALQERTKSASGVGKTRLDRIIADVQAPMLTAQPE